MRDVILPDRPADFKQSRLQIPPESPFHRREDRPHGVIVGLQGRRVARLADAVLPVGRHDAEDDAA
jgi:hypothetical protein